jgi:hypothetical protein
MSKRGGKHTWTGRDEFPYLQRPSHIEEIPNLIEVMVVASGDDVGSMSLRQGVLDFAQRVGLRVRGDNPSAGEYLSNGRMVSLVLLYDDYDNTRVQTLWVGN